MKCRTCDRDLMPLKISDDAAYKVPEGDADVAFCASCQRGYWLTTDDIRATRLNRLLKQHIINSIRGQ